MAASDRGYGNSYMSSFMDNYREKQRIKGIKNKKKRKQQNRLRRALKDNKISKKEAKKLRKIGLNEYDVDRYSQKRHKRSVKNISSRTRARMPAQVQRKELGYMPPMFSKGAGRTFKGPMPAPKPAPAPKPTFEQYTPTDINKLIDDAIAKTTPPPAPEPPPPPQFVYNQPFAVSGVQQFSPANVGIQRSNPFQRSGVSSNLKINQTLNV